jgi:hypothetical protein
MERAWARFSAHEEVPPAARMFSRDLKVKTAMAEVEMARTPVQCDG